MLTLPAYFALGIALGCTSGTLLILFEREGFHFFGQIISVLMLFVSIFYAFPLLPRPDLGYSPYVYGSTNFAFIITPILLVSMIIPIYLSGLKGKRLSVGYWCVGSLISLSIPWSVSDLMVLSAALVSAAVVFIEGGLLYKHEKRREETEMRYLSMIQKKGEVSVEDVIIELGVSDAEADKVLYDLWDRGVLERREKGMKTIYYATSKED